MKLSTRVRKVVQKKIYDQIKIKNHVMQQSKINRKSKMVSIKQSKCLIEALHDSDVCVSHLSGEKRPCVLMQ